MKIKFNTELKDSIRNNINGEIYQIAISKNLIEPMFQLSGIETNKDNYLDKQPLGRFDGCEVIVDYSLEENTYTLNK